MILHTEEQSTALLNTRATAAWIMHGRYRPVCDEIILKADRCALSSGKTRCPYDERIAGGDYGDVCFFERLPAYQRYLIRKLRVQPLNKDSSKCHGDRSRQKVSVCQSTVVLMILWGEGPSAIRLGNIFV